MIQLSDIAALLGLVGAFCIAVLKRDSLAYKVWLLGNSLWIYEGIRDLDRGLIVQFVAFNLICLYGLMKPRK